MKFKGQIRKDGEFWIVEIPGLDLTTQTRTRRDALRMARAVVEDVIGKAGFHATAEMVDRSRFLVSGSDTDELVALMLRRQRTKRGLTVMEVSKRLGSTSPNAFGAYEQGRRSPSVSTLEALLEAIDPELPNLLKVG